MTRAEWRLRKKKEMKKLQFKAFPYIAMFPSLQYLAVNFFATGLVESAIAALTVQGDACDALCHLAAVLILLFLLSYFVLVFSVLWSFHRRFAHVYEEQEIPDDPHLIEDPLYRLVSKVRVRCCRKGRKHNIMDRARGDYVPTDDTEALAEPGRTERILQRPWIVHGDHASEVIAVLKFTFMNRAGGGFVGLTYDFVSFMFQMAVAALSGLGAAAAPGTLLRTHPPSS